LAILAVVAALIAAYHTLQYLHLLPFWIGPVAFFGFDPLGAILWGINTVIYLWVASMLWNMNPSGWLFVVFIAAWDLILAVLSIIGQSTFSAMLPAILINGVVLLYCLWPRTREAFQRA
jgi:hypothetical protein